MQPLADAGYRVFAIDLLGSFLTSLIIWFRAGLRCGYSSKPDPYDEEARKLSGENGRPLGAPQATLGTAGTRDESLACPFVRKSAFSTLVRCRLCQARDVFALRVTPKFLHHLMYGNDPGMVF
eukprot:5402698-Pyramimonas_sp.AAC.1